MSKLLREPLVHFLLGGLALFALYGQVAGPASSRPDRIVVSEGRVAMLAQTFERTWMRPPSPAELRGLVDDYVTEEILYREALALGLDQDDLVVRRRMRQKMEFLNEGIAEVEPDEADLRAFLEAHPERFALPPRSSFVQVFVASEGLEAARTRAAELLARLRRGEDAAALGDPTLLPREMRAATPAQVSQRFGAAFAERLSELPEGAWSGPIPSSFGLHLVKVGERVPGRLPALAEVRDAVAREWAAEQRSRARARFYEALRARYEIEVHLPDAAAAAPAPEVAGRP
jgi:hypothetical protein